MGKKPSLRVIPVKVEDVSTLTPAQRSVVLEACVRLKGSAGPLIPVLHAVQSALSYVPRDALPLIAAELNLSRAEVHGVMSFYHYFRQEPAGRHVIHVCRAEACQSLGAVALERHAQKTLGVGFHQTTADGAISLEPVYCLGNCALGPSVMVDDRLQGRVSAQRFDELVASARAEA